MPAMAKLTRKDIINGHTGSIDISVPKYDTLVKNINAINKDAETIIKRTVSDFKSRAPAWVSAAVTGIYGISKNEVKGAMKGAKKAVGRIKVSGISVDNVELVYKGRLLTPIHFKMLPKVPTLKKGTPYQKTISATFFKGKRQKLSRKAFLASTGGIGYIPFQREGKERMPIRPIKTLSIPQMIQNEKVAEQIGKNIEAGMSKRLEHHAGRVLNKRT